MAPRKGRKAPTSRGGAPATKRGEGPAESKRVEKTAKRSAKESQNTIFEYWTVGSKILLCGQYSGKGKNRAHWRQHLGWLGSKDRTVYNRYEAVGNPTKKEGDSTRYLWVLEKGEWIIKDEWMEYKDLVLECGRTGSQPHSWETFLEKRAGAGVGKSKKAKVR